MSIFSTIGKAIGGVAKTVAKVATPVIRTALSGAKALPVVGGAASIAEGVLFPNTGRSIDQIYTQASTGQQQPSPFEESLRNLIASVTARVNAVASGISGQAKPATAGFSSTSIALLAAAGIVGAILISRGKK